MITKNIIFPLKGLQVNFTFQHKLFGKMEQNIKVRSKKVKNGARQDGPTHRLQRVLTTWMCPFLRLLTLFTAKDKFEILDPSVKLTNSPFNSGGGGGSTRPNYCQSLSSHEILSLGYSPDGLLSRSVVQVRAVTNNCVQILHLHFMASELIKFG